MDPLQIIPLEGLPEFADGDDLARPMLDAVARADLVLAENDILVVTQKIVSKVEGRMVRLADVDPSPFAIRQASDFGKDPRLFELVLSEAKRIVRMDRGILITETHHGFVCANSGVDLSNVPAGMATLLPKDPDASAGTLRNRLRELAGVAPAIVISDTFGRPWRDGLVNVAIGVAGMPPLKSYKGLTDEFGHNLQSTILAVADELAAAAELVMGKLDKIPAVLVRGLPHESVDDGAASAYVRPANMDLFR